MVNRYNQIPAQVGNSEEVMAIAIKEGCIDGDNAARICDVDTGKQSRDLIVSTRDSSSSVPFHRHCQKTVCSAYGYDGQGATWDILSRNSDSLSNLPSDWLTYFTKNDDNNNNITQDLRSILELINKVAGNTVAKEWNLIFRDNHNGQIARKTISPWNNSSSDYVFSGFGKDIELSIDGQTLKFNTMKSYGTDVLSIDFDKKSLTVNFNGDTVNTVSEVYMSDDVTVDINQDYNHIPFKWYDFQNGTTIDGFSKAIRYSPSDTTMASPKFKIHSKYLNKYPLAVVEWEYHVNNPNATTLNLTINEDTVQVGGTSRWFTRVVGLTDQLYVEAGKTNVYVFRGDMQFKVLTYSLAYVY